MVEIYRRNSRVLNLTVTDEADAAVDLTGCTVHWVVCDAVGTALIEKSMGAGITIENAAAGQIRIDLAPDDTDIPPGTYQHELLVIDENGNRYTALAGQFTVLPSLTVDIP